ncbi:hypothetical protein IR083_20810 [Dysgonomonas sp. GY75]|uniref:hypothetical protein n=1 Tax=Dysgonomonas sp. GY75 TaxID=2780419 RepID=UPI00188397DF|nr:hypothetical protein [Dysgonomonas sp. GY75]MBF0651263.1 hypothetical protein [Dysgonomonas sp. GY75]
MAVNIDSDSLVPQEALNNMTALKKEFIASIDAMEKMLDKTDEASKAFSQFNIPVKELVKSMESYNKLQNEHVKVIDNARKAKSDYEKQQKKIIDIESEEYKTIERARIELSNKKKEIRDAIKEEINLSKANKLVADSVSDLNDKMSKPNEFKLAENAESELKRLTVNLGTAKEAMEGLKNAPDISQAIEKAADGSARYNDAISEGNIRLERLTFAQNTFADALAKELITKEEYNSLMSSSNHIYEKQEQDVKSLIAQRNKETDATKILAGISTEAYNMMDASLQEYYRNLVEVQTELSVNKQQQKELDDLYKKGSISLNAYTRRKASLMVTEKNLKDAQKANNDLIKYTTQLVNSEVGSYENLSAQYAILKIRINQMGEAEGKELKVKKDLEKQAEKLYKQMDAQQQATGKYTLNVGNYKVATEDLTKTIGLLNPAFMSAATGAAAMGKQLLVLLANPIVATIAAIVATLTALYYITKEVAGAAKENEEQYTLLQQAMAPVHVMSDKLTNSLHPLVTVWLLVAKATGEAIVKFSDWIGLTDDAVKKTKEYAQHEKDSLQLKIYNRDAMVKNAKDEVKIAGLRAQIADKENLSHTERLAKIKEIEDLERGIYVRKKTSAVLEDNLLKEEAARTANSTEMNDKLAQSEVKLINTDKERQDSLRQTARLRQSSLKGIKADIKEQESALEKYNKMMARLRTDNEKATIESDEILFKKQAETQKSIVQDERRSYEDRMAAANEFENLMSNSINERVNKQEIALRAQYNKDVEIAKKAGKTMLSFEEEYAAQLEALHKKREEELNKISIEGGKLRTDIANDALEEQVTNLKKALDTRLRAIDTEQSEEEKKLSEKYASGEINAEKYEKGKTDAAIKAAGERLQAEIDMLEEMAKLTGLSEQQMADLSKRLADAKLAYQKHVNDELVKSNDDAAKKREAIEKKTAQLSKELAKETFDFLKTLADASDERELQRLEKQGEANDEWREREQKAIEDLENAGAISKEQAEARKAAIDQQAQAREDEIESRKKKIEYEAAKRAKVIAIAETAINMAAAIMKNTAQLGFVPAIPVNILTGLLGAVQISTIASQPLPALKYGTDDFRGGPAIVGDGGKPELILTPSGKAYKTPSIPTLVDMPQHSIVYPDFEAILPMLAMPKMDTSRVMAPANPDYNRQWDTITKETSRMHNSLSRGMEALQRELIDLNKSTRFKRKDRGMGLN